jgi:diguanylate cyclase (GGDEF)-like protein
MSCFSVFLSSAYNKYKDDKNQYLWLHAWAGCTALTSSIFAIGLVYFTPFEQLQYTVALGLFVVALSAGSIMIYSVSMYAMLSFLLPIMSISVYFLLNQSTNISTMTALVMGLYSFITLLVVKETSSTFKTSVLLSMHYQQEQEKRQLLEQQLQDINRRDGLTGVFNRRYFDEMLETEIGRAHRNHLPLCVIMFDLDYFKEYNEHYGHIAGDTCLMNVAEIAQNLANRQGDLVARYGGEEFAVILPNIDLQGAVAFANKLQQEIQKKRFEHVTSKLTSLQCVTVSLGVANLMPFTKVKPSGLIKYAETALFEAKRQGRNRVHFNENNGLNKSASL